MGSLRFILTVDSLSSLVAEVYGQAGQLGNTESEKILEIEAGFG
jgi:hypothetical protein